MTVAILGINSLALSNAYLFLLPLVVILPSYIVLYDYWKCVVRAATYLRFFYEMEPGCPYHWEGRHSKFDHVYKKYRKHSLNMHTQQLPYISCAVLCLLLFFVRTGSIFKLENGRLLLLNSIECLIGVLSALLCFSVFMAFGNVKEEYFI